MELNISELKFRKINEYDYDEFLSLINDFKKSSFTEEQFVNTLYSIYNNSDIYVLQYGNTLIATGKLLFEKKFIHNICILGHIEDVCVKKEYRNCGIGKIFIKQIIEEAKNNGCYKVTLNCLEQNELFYKKSGLNTVGKQMSIYF